MVPGEGVEPSISWLQIRCLPSQATPANGPRRTQGPNLSGIVLFGSFVIWHHLLFAVNNTAPTVPKVGSISSCYTDSLSYRIICCHMNIPVALNDSKVIPRPSRDSFTCCPVDVSA